MTALKVLLNIIIFMAGLVVGAGIIVYASLGRIRLPLGLDKIESIQETLSPKGTPEDITAYRPKNFEILSVQNGKEKQILEFRFNMLKSPKAVYIVLVDQGQRFSWQMISRSTIFRAEVNNEVQARIEVPAGVTQVFFYVVVDTRSGLLIPYGEVNLKSEGAVKPFVLTLK